MTNKRVKEVPAGQRIRHLGLALTALGGGYLLWRRKNAVFRWIFLLHRNDDLLITESPKEADIGAFLTTAQVEGPFFLTSPLRCDVREDRQGVPMNFTIEVMSVPDSKPVKGAIVEIWHCDAQGIYSGYPEDGAHDFYKSLRFTGLEGMMGKKHVEPVTGARFLRGGQRTDENGRLQFKTIYPGWYEPRATHIHFKVAVSGTEHLTSQFYLDAKFSNDIYTRYQPYRQYGECPYSVENDLALHGLDRADGLLLRPQCNEKGEVDVYARIGILGKLIATEEIDHISNDHLKFRYQR